MAVLDSLRDYYDTITQLLWELLGLVNEFYYGIVCPLYELLGEVSVRHYRERSS